jgi:predicted DNA binding protein
MTPKAFLACFEDVFSGIMDEYNVIGEYDEAVLVQYEMPTPELYHAGSDLGSLTEFPIPIRNGWLIFDLTLPEEALAYLEGTFDELGYPYEITAVTRSYNPVELLTPRQQEFLTTAIEQGYYDNPRVCTLTELAEDFGVNKSAASGILHRAEGKAIKEFMGFSQ